jgi:hypothetical protein
LQRRAFRCRNPLASNSSTSRLISSPLPSPARIGRRSVLALRSLPKSLHCLRTSELEFRASAMPIPISSSVTFPPFLSYLTCPSLFFPVPTRCIQIWTALVAMLLVKILQSRSLFAWALSNLGALLCWKLFTDRDLWSWINRTFDTPPESRPSNLSSLIWTACRSLAKSKLPTSFQKIALN